MDLTHGAVYDIEVSTRNGCIWATWINENKVCKCPYKSLRAFASNWKDPY